MKKITFILVTFFSLASYSQVGINNTAPDAMLDVTASNQLLPENTDGLLIPRIDAFPLVNPGANQNSMLVYLTTTVGLNTPGFYFWENATTSWQPFFSGNVGWDILGNAGTDENVNFLGTTDGQDVRFRRNNVPKMNIDFSNTSFVDEIRVRDGDIFGTTLLRLDDSANSNSGRVTIYRAGSVQHIMDGEGNVIFNETGNDYDFRVESNNEFDAFYLNANNGQLTFGHYGTGSFTGTPTQSLAVDTNGNIIEQPLATDVAWALLGNAGTVNGTNFLGTTDNVALDVRTNNVIRARFTNNGQIETLNTGQAVLIGEGAGAVHDNSATRRNILIGYEAGNDITTAVNNTAIGWRALDVATTNVVNNNVVVGQSSMGSLTTGTSNVSLGVSSLGTITTANNNVAIGANALSNSVAGDNNVAIGLSAGSNSDSNDNVFIGAGADTFNHGTNGRNVVIGTRAGESGVSGTSGGTNYQGRVLIGYEAGGDLKNNNTLYIENSSSPTPLIYGEFDNNILRVGGQLQIGSSNDATVGSIYGFPTVDGTNGQALVTDGAGNVSWSNASAGAWSITGNAGTNDATNFLGTTDAVDLVFRTANTERVRIDNATGNLGIGVNPQPWAKTFSFSNNAGIDALVGYHDANGGFGIYGRSVAGFGVLGIDTDEGIGVQGQVNTEIGIGVVAVNQDEGLAIYAETSGAGDSTDSAYGVYSVIDQATDSGNENSAPIAGINVTAVSGSGFASPFAATAPSAISGVTGVVASKHTSASNDEYSFGVVGEVLLDTSVSGVFTDVSGGVLGSNGQGDFGILGYQSSNGTLYSVYGGGANGSINPANTGRNNTSNPKPNNTIGIGLNSGFMGGYMVGSQYGIVSKGEEFGSYTMGNTIVNSPIVQLDDVKENERVATYASMSTSVDVTSRGKGQLENGTTFVAFDRSYAKLIDVENININITPMGETKGVYVTDISANGFRVKENMSGASNARFNWTAVATKKNFENGVQLSSTVLSSSFESNMNGVMHNDENKSTEATPIYFDGNEVKFERKTTTSGNAATIIKRDVVVDKIDAVETNNSNTED